MYGVSILPAVVMEQSKEKLVFIFYFCVMQFCFHFPLQGSGIPSDDSLQHGEKVNFFPVLICKRETKQDKMIVLQCCIEIRRHIFSLYTHTHTNCSCLYFILIL
jgi:hypothetical protein